MEVQDITRLIEQTAPLGLQEGFDNAGLMCGSPEMGIDSCLVCLDVTKKVVKEAITLGAKLIIAHHPLIFNGLKNLVPDGGVNDVLIDCIRHDIAVYAAHTNLDKVPNGVSGILADKLGLLNQQILSPEKSALLKLIAFVPGSHISQVSDSLFAAGAGHIGEYDSCSFVTAGEGSFRALDGANPYVGEPGELHKESELRLEVVLPAYLKLKVVQALMNSHPYEEVAYDLFALENEHSFVGLGIIGDLPEPVSEEDFLSVMKEELDLRCIRHTGFLKQKVSRIAVCGGTGYDFLSQAITVGAQIYVSADFKYHQFFEAGDKILIADVGHYESEHFAKEVIKRIVTENLPNFAVHLSKINTNPINYF
ncbi:MAG: Nif3-like dinuclear metal center hexameric protein [Bacteroidales bacterium]|nr:Nif3-like dinuclear metal center hexameric protein [Bacteroidales bacterium]